MSEITEFFIKTLINHYFNLEFNFNGSNMKSFVALMANIAERELLHLLKEHLMEIQATEESARIDIDDIAKLPI